MRAFFYFSLLSWLMLSQAFCVEELFLRDNLMRAKPGDYLVTAQGNHYALLLIRDKTKSTITIEEISIPGERFPKAEIGRWRDWVGQGAPGHTSWVVYEIEPATGEMLKFFSYTQNGWCDIPDGENFLGTLLNLRLQRMSDSLRRRVGPMPREGEADRRPFWNPRVVVEGQVVEGVIFNAWRTRWPKDGSELSGKMIDVFLPKEGGQYPSYFPYWLQVGGLVGKAKVRIIDSGAGLTSPKPPLAQPPPRLFNTGKVP